MKVQNVITRDTGRDISALINEAAELHGFDPLGFLGGAIAESNLDERSFAERRWPDVSYGLFHPAVKWAGAEIPLERFVETAGRPPVARDTPENRRLARDYLWDAARSIAYVAPRYAALLRTWGDPLAAWCRWNKPNIDPAANPNRRNYERGLAAAESYAIPDQEEPAMPPTDTTPETPPTLEEQVAQLRRQQALQTHALRRILENELEGADGAAGAVVALEGGQTTVDVRLGKG